MGDIIRDFWDDHKTAVIITGIIVIALIVGTMVFSIVYDPLKIIWSGNDGLVIATEPTKLNITAQIYNKKGSYNINWATNGGNINTIGNSVVWQLPEEEGTYELVATTGEKSFTKKVTVLKNPLVNYLDYETAPVKHVDTDGDGLSDTYEQQVSKTDSNLLDTDNDGINDGDELELGLDPLKEMTDGKIKDIERTLTYTYNDAKQNVEITLTGKGNLTNTTIDSYETETLYNIKAIVSDVYILYTDSDITNADIKFKYDKDSIKSKGIDENNLSVYRFNSEGNKFEKVESKVDTNTSQISINSKTLGKYFIADSSKIKSNLQTNLMFVIDNSGSMYSAEEVEGSSANDVGFQRVDLSNKIIDRLVGDYKFGAGKFTFEYSDLVNLTNDKELAKSSINKIKTDVEKFTGTYIGEALNGGLKQFTLTSDDLNRNYLILLTDGKDTTEVKGYDKEKLNNAVKEAISKNVKIITIGLGNEVDKKVLYEIATKTDGKYYYAADATSLEGIFDSIASLLNYNLIDTNKDNTNDSISLYDSEFMPGKDGFAFSNFSSTAQNSGATYGMSLIAKLYYEDKLPLKFADISFKVGETTVKATGCDLSQVPLINENIEPLGRLIMKDLKDFNTPWLMRSSSLTNKTLPLNATSKQILLTKGFTTYYQPYVKGNAKFDKYENYMLDMQSEYYKQLNSSDRQLINALYRFDILKYKSESFDFKEDPSLAMLKLSEALQEYSPTLLVLNNNYTVLANKIICDTNNPNKMKIEIYDSNTSGITKYIDVERIKMNTIKGSDEKLNKYEYKFKYEGVDVTVGVNIPNLTANL